ncbi:MAG: type VI secretion system tube protein Hcp [Pseudomonadota bacterium]
MRVFEFRAALAAVLLWATLGAAGQGEAFIEIEDIPGDSTISGFEDLIVVESWSQGVVNLDRRAVVLPFRFTHEIDRSTPKLIERALMGNNVGDVTLRVTQFNGAVGQRFEFFTLVLRGANIVSVQSTGVEGDVPREEVTVGCLDYKITFREQNDNGTPGDITEVEGSCGAQ